MATAVTKVFSINRPMTCSVSNTELVAGEMVDSDDGGDES